MSLLFAFLTMVSLLHAEPAYLFRGGTQAMVCPQADGKLKVELLSFWEGRNYYNWQIAESNAPVADQVREKLPRLEGARVATFADSELNDMTKDVEKSFLAEEVDSYLKGPNSSVHMLWLENATLPLVDEGYEDAWEAGCHREQLVLGEGWDNGAIFKINKTLYDAMSPTNQAGMILEQAIRQAHGSMLPRAGLDGRRTVAYVFSGGSFDAWPDKTLKHVTCSTPLRTKPFVDVTLFTDKSGELMSSVFNGWDALPVGFYPQKPRLLHALKEKLETILTAKDECNAFATKPGRSFVIAALNGGGPVDFDKSGNLIGNCIQGKLHVYWTTKSFGTYADKDLTELVCGTGKPLP